MTDSVTRRVLRWVFGAEGTVAAESETQVVMAATAMAISGIYAMSPILSALTGPFAVSDARIGALITAYTAPSVVLVPVVGVAADQFGRRDPLVGGLILIGIGGAAVALTSDFTVVLALRVVQGVGFAAVNPLGVTVIGDLFEGSREMTAQGLRAAGINTAALVSPPLAGALVIGAWQYPFLLYAAALPVAAWAWVTLPSSSPSSDESTLREYLENLITLLRRPALAAIQLSFVARFALAVGYYAYISVLLTQAFEATSVETGLVVAGVSLAALAGATQVGRLVVARDEFEVLLAAMLAVGIGIAVMGAVPSYLAVGIGGVLLGAGVGISAPVQKGLVNQLAPATLRAGAVSSALLFQSIGQAVGPLLLGLLVAWYRVDMAFVAFGVVGGVLSALAVAVAARAQPAIDSR